MVADRRAGRGPYVGGGYLPRSRTMKGRWAKKRSDTGKKRENGCFIATACYGTNSNEVEIFRRWRDNKLSKNKFGNKFINLYYKTSPPIAKFISNKPNLKRMIQIGLYPIKEMVKNQ